MKKFSVLFLLVNLAVFSACSTSSLQLPSILGDHMVLQQNSNSKVWGWAEPKQVVKVTTSWNQETYSTHADQQGRWELSVATGKAGGPYTISIQAEETKVLEDILLGEVWICFGQSNMEWPLSGVESGEKEIPLSD